MGRPRIHPRRYYRAIETGVYVDQETGDELTYYKHTTVLPDKDQLIPVNRQEKLAKKLVAFGVFERMDDGGFEEPEEIERVSSEPAAIRKP